MLNSDRGTMLRLSFWTGEKTYHFDPLEIGASGFVVRAAECLNTIHSLNENFDDFCFVDANGDRIELDLEFTEFDDVRALVIYPDGSLWDGSLHADSGSVSGFFWCSRLLKSLDEGEFLRLFHKKLWQQVPTTLLIRGGELHGGCARIEHQCGKQCEIKLLIGK